MQEFDQMEQDALKSIIAEPFMMLVFSLVNSAMLSLGLMPNPITQKAERDLDQVQSSIDMLAALQEKTRGNLNPKEQEFLDTNLTQLRLMFVEVMKEEKSGRKGK